MHAKPKSKEITGGQVQTRPDISYLNVRYRKKHCMDQVMRREKWQKNNQNQMDKKMKRKERDDRRHRRKTCNTYRKRNKNRKKPLEIFRQLAEIRKVADRQKNPNSPHASSLETDLSRAHMEKSSIG